MAKTQRIPEYVKKNLEYFLAREPENPEYYGKRIQEISLRWGV